MRRTGRLASGDLRVEMDSEDILTLIIGPGDVGKDIRSVVVDSALYATDPPAEGTLVGWRMESYMPIGLVVSFDAPVSDPT